MQTITRTHQKDHSTLASSSNRRFFNARPSVVTTIPQPNKISVMVREMEDPDEAATKSLRLTSGPKYLSQFSSSTYMGLSVVILIYKMNE